MALASSKPLLSDILSGNNEAIPSNFVRPISDRPNLLNVDTSEAWIPLIDLQGLNGSDRPRVVKAIGLACQNEGFFQVKGHGIPDGVIDDMLRVSREFFCLPESERMKLYSEDPMKTTRLSTSFNVRTEKFGSWRDYLRLHCYPLEDFIHEWPSSPPQFKKVAGEYCKQVRRLTLRILEAISESLGLEGETMSKALGKHAQFMAINYYPRCPQPELAYGLPGHKDPSAITLLLQDGVSGLQVLREDGKWAAVTSDRRTLVINLGDQMQALSNGRYKSVLHRAVVNNSTDRISIPTFYSPSYDAVIKTPESLIEKGLLPKYRSYAYQEYYEKFWKQGLNAESCLDMFKSTE